MTTMADLPTLHLPALAASFTLADAYLLVSPWKPVLFLLPLLGWGMIITRIYDKHAAQFHLGRRGWNILHVTAGAVAFLAGFLMPIPGVVGLIVGLAVQCAILGIDLAIYPLKANKDERVPEAHKVKIDFSAAKEAKRKKAEAKQLGTSELVVRGPDKVPVAPPKADSPEFAVRLGAEQIIIKAQAARATRFEIAPAGKDNAYRVVHTVDSLQVPAETLPAAQAVPLIDMWKSMAKMDVQDRRKKQSADATIEKGTEKHTIRLTAIGVQGGMKLSGVFDPSTAVRRKTADLGLLETQQAELEKIIAEGTGVVLLAAPGGQGRTTLLYSIIRNHDAYTSNVQTLEFEVQDALEGIRQNVFDPMKEGAEFATTLRSILRRDPSVVGVAEMPDAATALEVSKSEADRVRVYLTLRTDGALNAIMAYAKAVGDNQQAASALRGVIAGKLLRNLCVNCRVPYQPPADLLKKLGLPADKVTQLYKKGGQVLIKNKPEVCPICAGGGYAGVSGILEIFSLDQAARDRIAAGDWNGLRTELRKRGLPTIQQAALRKAVDGFTSIEEVMRVTAEPKPASPAPAKKPDAAAPQKS